MAEFLRLVSRMGPRSEASLYFRSSRLPNTPKHRGEIHGSHPQRVTNSPELGELLRSLAVEIPRDTFKTPKWDLALVLASLAEKPYEPIESAELKCAFLLALASAKRISELQALAGKIHQKQD